MSGESRPGDGSFWTPVMMEGLDEQEVRRNFASYEVSKPGLFLLAVQEILDRLLGFGASAASGRGELGDGRPIPLMSYGAVEYLLSLDLSDKDVLELGGGQSTLFWAAKARSVRTLEHDVSWMGDTPPDGLANVTIDRIAQRDYVQSCRALVDEYDIIVVDCAANRLECARAAAPRLRAGGMVILDNSDWYPNTAALLRGLDLIQVDYPDFRPAHHYRCTTSLFLHRAFVPSPAGDRLPPAAIGGKDVAATNGWDQPGGV